MGFRTISVLFLISSLSCWTSIISATYLTQLEQNTLKEKGITLIDYSSNYWLFKSNGIPKHATGVFPNANNPNTISQQDYQYLIPKNPVRFGSAYQCLNMGIIAFASNGVPLFNAYSAEGFNAVEGPCCEIFDSCNAHPDTLGRYHYHQFPNCLYSVSEQYSRLYGVALDGFPIYGPYELDGSLVDDSKLDECHGRVAKDGRYEYRITFNFPYMLGCYRGIPGSQFVARSIPQDRRQMYPGSGSGFGPRNDSQMYPGSGSGSGSGPQGGNQMYPGSGSGSGSGPQGGNQMYPGSGSGSGSGPQGGNQMYSGSGSGSESGPQGGNQMYPGSGYGPQFPPQIYYRSGSGSGPQGGSQTYSGSGSGSGPQGGNQMYSGSGSGSGSGPQGGNQIYPGSGSGSGSGSGPQGGNQLYPGSGSGSGSGYGPQVRSQYLYGSGSGSGQQSGSQTYSGYGSASGPQGNGQMYPGSGSGYGPQSGSGSGSFIRESTDESDALAVLLKELNIDATSNRIRRSNGQPLSKLRQFLNLLAEATKRASSSCVKDPNWMTYNGVCPMKCQNPSLGCQ